MKLNWTNAKLENVVDILDNQRVPVNAKEREGRQGNVPYYGATGQVGWIDEHLFDEELILLGEDGAPFFDSSKQKAYIIRGKSWVNNHAHVLRTKAGIPSAYLKYFLDVVDYHGFVTGTTRAKLNQAEMRRLPLPLAPLNEQTRIVAEIEKQFSRLDEAVTNLKRVKANLKRYKAAVLKAAVEGKLTEEWRQQHPDVETADKLLERILAERRKAAGKGKYKEPVGPDTSGLPELPAGWVWASADQLAEKITDGEHLSPNTIDEGIPLLSAKDVREFGVLFDDASYVSAEDAEKFRSRCNPELGDILIVSRGATIGRSCIVNVDRIFCLMGSVILVKVQNQISSQFLLANLKSTSSVKRLQGVSGSTAQQAIYIRDIRSLPVPLASLAEQHQIVAEVERRLSIVAGAEAQVEDNLRRADRLRQSILKQAFSGRLVPQDPNDEPANVLLERIRHGVGAIHESPARATRKPKRAIHESPLRKPQQPAEPKPAASADYACLDDVTAAILARMQSGREYSRAELADALGLSAGRWNAAIRELKRIGKVRQVGERRGARYSIVAGKSA